jgi:hypothetical protein
MGCAIILLAAILCTMLFGPGPVLVILGIGLGLRAAYAILMLSAVVVGKLLAALLSLRRQKPSSGSEEAGTGARREPIFTHPAIGPIVLLILGAIVILNAVAYLR